MLFIEAANFVVFVGPWQVWFLGQGLVPRPTVKKNFLSTFCGTLAGNLAVAKLLNLLVKLATKFVALIAGKPGLRSGLFFKLLDGVSYSRIPATVVLSKVPMPVAYGLANIKKVALGALGLVFRRTLVVCPGVIINTLVSKGFTYTASASTTVKLWSAMLKKSSSLSAALINLRRYVFPGFTFSLYVSVNHKSHALISKGIYKYIDTYMCANIYIPLAEQLYNGPGRPLKV